MKHIMLCVAILIAVAGIAVVLLVQPSAQEAASQVDGGGLNPIDNYKKKIVSEAMRGLVYDDGRVALDLDNARDLTGIGDLDAARERLARGMSHLENHNQIILAITEMTDAVVTAPDSPEMYVGLGIALDMKGKVDAAEAAFRTALDLDADSIEARSRLAALLYANGSQAEAIDEWNVVLLQDPDDAAVHLRLALAQYYAGDFDRSEEHLGRAEAGGADVPPQFRSLLEAATGGVSVPKIPVSFAGSGPTIGPQVRVDVGGGTEAANETSAASSDGDPDEVVATANDWRQSTSQEIIRMSVSVTQDGGDTWTDFLVRPPAPNQSTVEGDPMTAYDNRTGTLWVGAISFTGSGGLYVAKKTPGQPTFEPSVQVGQLSFADKCWMAAGQPPGNPNATNVYIAYNEGVWRSSDMGSSWQGPVSLDTGIGFLPRVADDGDLYVCYWDFSNGHWVKRSSTGGTSFGSRRRIATRMDVWGTQDGSRFPGMFRVPAFGALAVDPNDETLYHIYPDTTNTQGGNANVDLYLTTSVNDGTTWSTPVAIDFDGPLVGDQLFPWVEVDATGRLHMVYYDSKNTVQNDNTPNGMFDAYYAYSEDGGASWNSSRLTPAPFNSINDGLDRGSSQFIGDYLGVAIGGSKVYPCYLSTQNGDSDIFVHAIDFGEPPFLTLALTTDDPVVAPGELFFADAILDTDPNMGQTVVDYVLTAEQPDGSPFAGNPLLSRTKSTPAGIHKERELRFRPPAGAQLGTWKLLLTADAADGRHAEAELSFQVSN